MNYREVGRWFGVAFFLVLMLALIVIPVQAAINFRPIRGIAYGWGP